MCYIPLDTKQAIWETFFPAYISCLVLKKLNLTEQSKQHRKKITKAHKSKPKSNTPFTRYNRFYNRFDNRLYRVNKHATGCQPV